MRRTNVSAPFGPLFLSMFLVASTAFTRALHAQAPAAGTSVAVRMIEAVDSSKDPAGKQYHASVAKAVDAGNGVMIPQGAPATVTLVNSGSGWTTQLVSVTINGQPVAVTSGSASVTSAAQSTAGNAINTMNSVLGGFGRHANAPAPAVTAVAMGQRVVLPPGITLSFVLRQPPAANSGGATAQAAPAAQPASVQQAASAMPAPMGGGVSAVNAPNSPATNPPVSAGALAATIQETLLGPSKQAAMFVVSPDGGHYAAPAMHGMREVIVIDGVDGPEFDHAAHTWSGQALDFVFSQDGTHSAYVGQSGNDLVEVRDGKTAFTIASFKPGTNLASSSPVPKIDLRLVHNPGHQVGGGGHQCLMSPSGAHVAVVAHLSASMSGGYYMFLDGVKSPEYNFIDTGQVAFVAEKLVYIAQTDDHQFHLVVNDKPGPAYSGLKNLLVNDDSSHYAFLAGTAGKDGWGVGVDGVMLAAPRGIVAGLYIASNGRVTYAMEGIMNGATATLTLPTGTFVDGHVIPSGGLPFQRTDKIGLKMGLSASVLFSPDGKRLAYVKKVPGGFAPVIDDKVGPTYDAVKSIQFSPDSQHYLYVAERYVPNQTFSFAVYDGKEMPGEDPNGVRDIVLSQTGGHYAYLANSAQAGIRMVVDGKTSPRFPGFVANSMSFSEDGSHYVYAIQMDGSHFQLIRDGVATSVMTLGAFTNVSGPPRIDFPQLMLSADGGRLVWVWEKSDGVSGNTISIDGQEILHSHGTYEFPEFSPDGRHFATMVGAGNKVALAVDGKTGPGYDAFLATNPNAARFLDSHTFRFLGVKNGSVYRVTVNLGG